MLNPKICQSCRKEKLASWNEVTWDEKNLQKEFVKFKVSLNIKKSWYCPSADSQSSDDLNTVHRWSEIPKLCDYTLEHLYSSEESK